MLSFQKPSNDSIRRFLTTQKNLNFTYSAIGATAAKPPAEFVVDHTRMKLGEGEAVFQSAITALRRWQHFHLGWVEAWPPDTPLQPGELIAVMGHAAGLWWLNCCRIVYVVCDSGPIRKFGYAYGTLPCHIESGEERFLIEWDTSSNSVYYDILAFSRPNCWIARLGYPFVRRMQKRFGRDSAAAVFNTVNGIP